MVASLFLPVREDPGLVGLCDDDDDSCLKNSLGFMERWDTKAAASYRSNSIIKKLFNRSRFQQYEVMLAGIGLQ